MELSRRTRNDQVLILREVEESDLHTLVDYWMDASDDHLELLGVDRTALGSRDDIEGRFRSYLPSSGPIDKALWVTTVDGVVSAYVNIHLKAPDENYLHGHIIRADLRGRGIGYDGTLNVVRQAFARYAAMESILLVTQPHNERVNGLLTKLGLRSQRRYLERPDGLPQPGWFFVYEITRQMVEAVDEHQQSLSAVGA